MTTAHPRNRSALRNRRHIARFGHFGADANVRQNGMRQFRAHPRVIDHEYFFAQGLSADRLSTRHYHQPAPKRQNI